LSLSIDLDPLYEAEKLLREVATFVQEAKATPGGLRRGRPQIQRYLGQLRTLSNQVSDLSNKIHHELLENVPEIEEIEMTPSAFSFPVYIAGGLMQKLGEDLESCDEEFCVATSTNVDLLERYVRNLTGKSCRFNPGSNDLALVTNDLASCTHILADYLSQNAVGEKISNRCYALKSAKEPLKKACKAWDEIANGFIEDDLYLNGDARALTGIAKGDILYLRTGSSPGHATNLDLKDRKLQYYDDDDDVNDNMKDIFESEAHLKCTVKQSSGVECTGLNENNVEDAAKSVAAATSMDLRMKYPDLYWNYMGNERTYDDAWNKAKEELAPKEPVPDWRNVQKPSGEILKLVKRAELYASKEELKELKELSSSTPFTSTIGLSSTTKGSEVEEARLMRSCMREVFKEVARAKQNV
jgi:hypothetical protein